MNYFIQGEMIIDLKNNIAFIYSDKTLDIGAKMPPVLEN